MTENVSSVTMDNFENPKNESLEKVEIVIYVDGVPKIVPALSKHWATKKYVLKYKRPEIYHEDGSEIIGAKDMWLETVNFIIDDFSWLLKLPFYKFWSNIFYCRRYLHSVISVLEESPRFYELTDFPDNDDMKKALQTLHKKVINICARIVTRKMSMTEFISKEYHAGLIYNNYLMTVPTMMHLCQLFGRAHENVISKIIKNAVKYQPRYCDDFKVLVQHSCEMLVALEERLLGRPDVSKSEPGVIYISRADLKKSSNNEINCTEVEDMIVYLMDFVSSVEILLTIYPRVIEYFSSDYFLMKITNVYENIYPELYKRLEKLVNKEMDQTMYLEMTEYMEIARVETIRVYRSIIFKGIASILEQPDIKEAKNVKELIDEFLNYLTSAVADKHLIIDYNKMYSITDDLEMIHQITSDVDPVKEIFLTRSVTEVIVNYSPTLPNNVVNSSNDLLQSVAGPSGAQSSINTMPLTVNSTNMTEVEIKSLISNVKDVMYDLGEGFIQKCLKHYNYNVEAVINALLEDSLPPDIKKLDKQLPYIPEEHVQFIQPSTSVDITLAKGIECIDIYDDEVCDTQRINAVKVHRGKRKNQYKNLNEMLNDKSFKNEVAESYSKYSVVEGYDDEYDDTYDDHDDGVILLDEDREIDLKRFTTPRILQRKERTERFENDDEEEDEEKDARSGVSNGRDNFVQDPAVLRAKAEQRHLTFHNRNRGRKKSGDVVGNPKGQGNDKEVLMNRDTKNTHKASRANHNRRSGAEWKRRQGMVPS